MNDKPSRFQFSLRTMLATMIVASVMFGWWVHRSKEWIRQRHEANGTILVIMHTKIQPNAPGALWLFDEEGAGLIHCSPRDAEEAQRIFPEARTRAILGRNLKEQVQD